MRKEVWEVRLYYCPVGKDYNLIVKPLRRTQLYGLFGTVIVEDPEAG